MMIDSNQTLGHVAAAAVLHAVELEAVARLETAGIGLVGDDAQRARLRAGAVQRALRSGQRLDTVVAENGALRLVRTLVPGAYFLRLQGWNRAEGTYAVTLARPSRDH